MPFEHIHTPKGADLVADSIRERIVSGELPPGAKLPSVASLAKSFQVGLSTIREALSALKATGWLDIRHGSGTYVAAELPREQPALPVDPFYLAESFRDLLEARQYIESGSAALAAARRTDADLASLSLILERMERALGDEAESEAADIAFHLRIAEASGNALFLSMLQSLTERLQEHMKNSRRLWLFAERSSGEQLLAEHRSILDAIRDGDAAAASSRMMRHLEKVARTLQRLMKA